MPERLLHQFINFTRFSRLGGNYVQRGMLRKQLRRVNVRLTADNGYNEHFHWGRFDWMMTHSYLDIEMLSRNALFRNENGELVGTVIDD